MAAMNQNIVDLSQLNLEEMIREMGEEEVVRVMKLMIENSKKTLELQILINKEKKKTRKSKKETRG